MIHFLTVNEQYILYHELFDWFVSDLYALYALLKRSDGDCPCLYQYINICSVNKTSVSDTVQILCL